MISLSEGTAPRRSADGGTGAPPRTGDSATCLLLLGDAKAGQGLLAGKRCHFSIEHQGLFRDLAKDGNGNGHQLRTRRRVNSDDVRDEAHQQRHKALPRHGGHLACGAAGPPAPKQLSEARHKPRGDKGVHSKGRRPLRLA